MNNARRTLALMAVTITLAGCGGALPANGGLTRAPQAAQLGLQHRSPIDASLRGKNLLYASSIGNCSVFVYTYPRGKLVQTIDSCAFGFGPAFGLCTDKAGDVFMAMADGFSIFEFAHGGTQPIAQLENDSILPYGCAVDPKSGDLAVASVEGQVALYKNASGTPQIYSLSGYHMFFFCTFDDRGNLFVSGDRDSGGFTLAELPRGGTALREITVSSIIVSPGFAVQWDGRRVALGVTQGTNEFGIDRLRIHGLTAKIVGSTLLHGPPDTFEPFQFWIDGGTVIKPENGSMAIGFWNYPAGGDQTKELLPHATSLVGVTVSAGQMRSKDTP